LKKLFINIIGGLIPYKPARARVRNILRFGLVKSIRAGLREPKLKFPHKLAILAIAKNEGAYFKEWLEYHRLVGVEKFYIYDNESDDDTKKVLAPYIKSGIVEYTYRPGEKQQIPVYNEGVKKYKYDTEWLALIDLDEFLVPVADKTITEYLDSLPKNTSQVLAGWVMYGSNGHIEKPEGLVIENFKTRAANNDSKLPGWMYYKAIVKPRFVLRAKNHRHEMFAGRLVLECEGPVSGFRIRCNHYYCKSWQEYQRRKSRGDAYWGKAKGAGLFTKETFDSQDRNEVRDPIMDKYIERLKRLS
jgi:hypothetical protein